MEKIRALIVDDEPLAREGMRIHLSEHPDVDVIGECGDGATAVEAIRQLRPDLVFLDVQMSELDGFGVLRELQSEQLPAIVFVTAYDQYAVRAFDVHALDYLVKPFDDRRFFAALLRAKERARQRKPGREPVSRFVVRSREKIVFIKAEDIDWVEAADYYVSLHAGGRSHLLRKTMAEIEEELDPARFVRVHRSAIVNLDRVRELHPLFRGDSILVLQDGTKLRLSRARREEFERRLTK